MMPVYNFQPQFIDRILNKTKIHTVRRKRKHPTKVGDVLQLFTGMRTKHCLEFAEAPCTQIDPVIIKPWQCEVWIWRPEEPGDLYWREDEEIGHHVLLAPELLNIFVRHDGFDTTSDFFTFFTRYKTAVLDDFETVWWDPDRLKALR